MKDQLFLEELVNLAESLAAQSGGYPASVNKIGDYLVVATIEQGEPKVKYMKFSEARRHWMLAADMTTPDYSHCDALHEISVNFPYPWAEE